MTKQDIAKIIANHLYKTKEEKNDNGKLDQAKKVPEPSPHSKNDDIGAQKHTLSSKLESEGKAKPSPKRRPKKSLRIKRCACAGQRKDIHSPSS